MNRIKKADFKVKDVMPFEHLEFLVKNTTPYQRWQWLGDAWHLWRILRRTYPKRIIELQDKFREGKI